MCIIYMYAYEFGSMDESKVFDEYKVTPLPPAANSSSLSLAAGQQTVTTGAAFACENTYVCISHKSTVGGVTDILQCAKVLLQFLCTYTCLHVQYCAKHIQRGRVF